MVEMDIDSQGSVGGQNPSVTGNPQQPSRAEESHQKNGIDSERTESDGPGSHPVVGSMQHEEVQLKDITRQPELAMGKKENQRLGHPSASTEKRETTHREVPAQET
jgi:hypothetical protein